MPVHDWTRVDDGVFHCFHQDFVPQLARRLNAGLLPDTVYAAIERKLTTRDDDDPLTAAPDVLAVTAPDAGGSAGGGVALATAPPRVQHRELAASAEYVRRADRIAVRTADGDELVAVFELVSPGNKSSRERLGQFARKCRQLIRRGVHVLFVDLHPPTRRDPHGLHPVVWGAFGDNPYRPPAGKPFTLAAYAAGDDPEAFVEPVGVGDPLPDMPLFLTPGRYVPVPLEAVYQDCWAAFPKRWKSLIEPPADA